jgi:hypothetical protein
MATATDMEAASSAPSAARTASKVRHRAVVRFPFQCHAGITPALNRAIERMTNGNSLLTASDIIRLALHAYLLGNDPQYRQEIGMGNGSA